MDRDAWNAIVQQYFTQEMANDWNANNAYWAQYQKKVVANTMQGVYENFLYSYDQDLGMRSYGACVDLLAEKYGTETS